jgi:hypothetical protein
MFPHGRSLVTKLKDKPFAMLGVNLDEDVGEVRALVQQGKVTWPSWADGRDQRILRQWKVEGLPTVFLLDARGVIRHRFVGNPGTTRLDEAIDKLLSEVK